MQVIISWRHREPLKLVEEYINKKIAHIEKFSPRISKSTIVIAQEGQRNVVEFKITMDKAPSFLVKEQSYDIRQAIDSCIAKAERKIKHYEGKVRDKKGEKLI